RFLRIAEAAIAEVELGGRGLLRDQHTGRARQQLLQVVADHRGRQVEVDDRGLRRQGDLRAGHFRHLVLELGRHVPAPVVGVHVDARQVGDRLRRGRGGARRRGDLPGGRREGGQREGGGKGEGQGGATWHRGR